MWTPHMMVRDFNRDGADDLAIGFIDSSLPAGERYSIAVFNAPFSDPGTPDALEWVGEVPPASPFAYDVRTEQLVVILDDLEHTMSVSGNHYTFTEGRPHLPMPYHSRTQYRSNRG